MSLDNSRIRNIRKANCALNISFFPLQTQLIHLIIYFIAFNLYFLFLAFQRKNLTFCKIIHFCSTSILFQISNMMASVTTYTYHMVILTQKILRFICEIIPGFTFNKENERWCWLQIWLIKPSLILCKLMTTSLKSHLC